MEFILKARTFDLQLFDYGLNQVFGHKVILAPVSRTAVPIRRRQKCLPEGNSQFGRNPALGKGFPV